MVTPWAWKPTSKGFMVRYVQLPELLEEFAIARCQGNLKKVLAQWKKTDLFNLDELMLISLKETEAIDLLEIIHARHKRASTIYRSAPFFCKLVCKKW